MASSKTNEVSGGHLILYLSRRLEQSDVDLHLPRMYIISMILTLASQTQTQISCDCPRKKWYKLEITLNFAFIACSLKIWSS